MISFWKLALFGLLPLGIAAAPLITGSGIVSAYYYCGGDCAEEDVVPLGEFSGEGPALNLSITRGDHVQTAKADIGGVLGPTSGYLLGTALGSCSYHGAMDICFGVTATFESSLEGQFVVTGGSGTTLLQPGEILIDGYWDLPFCEIVVNGVSGMCGDAFELTFGVPFDLALRFSGDIQSEGDDQFFSLQYSLERARDFGTGTEYAMSSLAADVPEPHTILMVAVGLLGAAYRRTAR